ncbi:DUF4435 domain-containing protein [Morganella morganii subsp. morganii]|uniref:DUF4435 domain-containing protein n=1 Tax=Morganella morganii TaxID=582 RepID=UPI001BD93FF7|nr:DUF4435 domain-containing protein [Morganella morganii]MBT0394332.1 DUF4435 domain-containing protein [Morganella morganii subsp. morganii]
MNCHELSSDDDLSYSSEAENIMHEFYEAHFIVYVEGVDDICFWETIFSKFNDYKYEVLDVGGCANLKGYIGKIIKGEINSLVALDSDFNCVLDGKHSHNKIIYTYGYSIENTYISFSCVNKMIKHLAKLNAKAMAEITDRTHNWFTGFLRKINSLVKVDVCNALNEKGFSVLGDSIHRFLDNNDPSLISTGKVTSHVEKILADFPEYCEKEVDDLLERKNRALIHCIRSHFLYSAIACYVRYVVNNNGKKIALSNESLYANFIAIFENEFNERHPEYIYYQNAVNNAVS